MFDDCPNGSARSVVDAIDDRRVSYRKNRKQLGTVGNIDQCFRNTPFAAGQFGCVLEDDNYFLPRHLERQLETCRSHKVDITFTAQACEEVVVPGEPGRIVDARTIAWIYNEGEHEPEAMFPAILFSHAYSNGSVFWRIGIDSNFEIGGLTTNTGIQETARIFCLKDKVYVSHEPTTIWRINDPKDSYVAASREINPIYRVRQYWDHLLERRQANALRRWYLRRNGISSNNIILSGIIEGHEKNVERTLLMCGHYSVLTSRSYLWRLMWMIRGIAFRVVVPNRLHIGAPGTNPVFEAIL